jgi:hypothetical protein
VLGLVVEVVLEAVLVGGGREDEDEAGVRDYDD